MERALESDEPVMPGRPSKPRQYPLRYLFYVTTSVAFGAWMISLESQPFLMLAGYGLVSYWVGLGLFAVAEPVHPVVAWQIKTFALLFYAYGVVGTLFGLLMYAFAWIMPYFE